MGRNWYWKSTVFEMGGQCCNFVEKENSFEVSERFFGDVFLCSKRSVADAVNNVEVALALE